MKRFTLASFLTFMISFAASHSAEGTPGIELHHIPLWGWVLVGLVPVGLLLFIYAKTHGKPLNPTKWR